MYDLRLTPEQVEFRDTVRDFVNAEVKPAALHPDRLQSFDRPFPAAVLDRAARIGLRTLSLSEDLGGAGADTLTACVVLEEVAAGDPDIALALGTTAHLAHCVFDRWATPEQRKRFLPAFLDDDRAHLACAAGDLEDSGWNYHNAQTASGPAGITAKRASDGSWRLDGTIPFVRNAPIAKLLIVRARVDGSGWIGALMPVDAPGVRVANPPRASGEGDGAVIAWHHGPGAAVTLEDCRVPGECLLADLGDSDAGERARVQLAAMNLGVGRAAFEMAVDYAKLRVQGGRPIIRHQSIGTLLAESAIRLESARNLVWKAAWACDYPDASATDWPLSTMARVHTAEAMYEVARAAAECFGAMGVMRDMPLQKFVHDALVFLHGAGHDSATKLEIAEAIAGFRRQPAAGR
jgi:alkylation response protein AidB-like acyl-CoA dehydrogenase